MKKLFEVMGKLKDNRNGDVVTFDFDNTIVKSFLNKTIDGEEQYQFGGVNKQIIKRIKTFKSEGKTVFIVTSRLNDLESGESSIKSLLKGLKIDVDGVFYTNGQPKAQKLYELGSTLHYDDDPKEREAIEAYKNLHKDFKILAKDPEELLRDVDAISKGVIITSDQKFIIAERSDSYEWDAPGGHIQEGEEPSFAFYREIKEELGIEVQEVQFLEMLETTWEGVTKDSFYFIGRIDYSSDQLEGVIDLQWEVSNYFCGDYEECLDKTKGNATQNLTNVMQLLQHQQELLESYQPHSRDHEIKKRTIVGLGGSKTTGATGLKRVKDHSRSKSAPPVAPGGGSNPSLEESVAEKSQKKIKISIVSDLDEKKKRKSSKKKRKSSKKKRKSNRGRTSYWPYGGFADYSSDHSDGDGGGDGGGGE
jgi:ADP-ribose pyrophosphatase YjhB (NUDIX family)